MVYNVIETFYKETPAVICTQGSYIAAANPAALSRLSHFFEGEALFDSMEPLDVLKYQAHFDSREAAGVYTFPLSSFHGYRYATAVFERIMGRRFAVVFLSRSKTMPDEKEISSYLGSVGASQPPELISKFLSAFLAIPEECFESADRQGLVDVKAAVSTAVKELCSQSPFIDCNIKLTENDEMKECFCMPADVPLPSLLQLTVLMVACAADISCKGEVELKLCKYGAEAEIRVITDAGKLKRSVFEVCALAKAVPSSTAFLYVADYIAGRAGGVIAVATSDNLKKLTMVLSLKEREFEDVDFKSRDCLKYFSDDFDFALKYIKKLALTSNAEQ